jgi:hypothetical protein
MAVEQRRTRSGEVVWYSTLSGWYGESEQRAQHEESQEITKRRNLAERKEEEKWGLGVLDGKPGTISPDKIHQMGREQHRRDAAEQAKQEQLNIVARFARDNSNWFTNDLHNRDIIFERIEKVVRASGREYAAGTPVPWGEHDLRLAVDSLAEEGVLHCHGPAVRQSPDTEAMETGELRQLAIDQIRGLGTPPTRR